MYDVLGGEKAVSYKNNPKIRNLETYAKKHGYAYVVVFAVTEDHTAFEINTYGRTKQLCKAAGLAGNQLMDKVKAGEWPEWPKDEPDKVTPKPDMRYAKKQRPVSGS